MYFNTPPKHALHLICGDSFSLTFSQFIIMLHMGSRRSNRPWNLYILTHSRSRIYWKGLPSRWVSSAMDAIYWDRPNICADSCGSPSVYSPVGAGDTFIAGMLYSLIYRKDDWDLSRKLKFANRVAGMKVGQEGFSGLGKALDGDFRWLISFVVEKFACTTRFYEFIGYWELQPRIQWFLYYNGSSMVTPSSFLFGKTITWYMQDGKRWVSRHRKKNILPWIFQLQFPFEQHRSIDS